MSCCSLDSTLHVLVCATKCDACSIEIHGFKGDSLPIDRQSWPTRLVTSRENIDLKTVRLANRNGKPNPNRAAVIFTPGV
jgi:hypothetical protein